jgi:hypothetical protein
MDMFEQQAEVCESCGITVTNCLSCGMPMTKLEDFGGGNRENPYCVHCSHPDGSLKNYEEVLNGMIDFMMKSRNTDRETAEGAAREYLSQNPAWNGH